MSRVVLLGKGLVGLSSLSDVLLLFGSDLRDHSGDLGVLLLSLGSSDLSSGVLNGEWVILVGWLRVSWSSSDLFMVVLHLGSVEWVLLLFGWGLDGWLLLH